MANCLISIDNVPKPLAEQLNHEQELIRATRQDQQARAHIWRAENTLVITKSESRLPNFAKAQSHFNTLNWPIVVRDTGGAAVPQSPDTLNLSLIYPSQTSNYSIEDSYNLLCKPIITALKQLNIQTKTTAVEGAFCDGKYNLAVTQNGKSKKIVGTSQKWTTDKIILAHAVILSSIDTDAATNNINTFYKLAGSEERKHPDVVTSILSCLEGKYSATALREQLTQKICAACESLNFNFQPDES